MNSPTHIEAIPVGMRIDVRPQAARPDDGMRGQGNLKWRPEWDVPVRAAALAGKSTAQIARDYGENLSVVRQHLTAMGLIWDKRLCRWVE